MTDTAENTCRSRLQITPRGQLTVMLMHLAAGAAWLSSDAAVRLAASMLAAPVVIDLLWKLATRPQLALALARRRGISRAPFVESLTVHNLSPRAAIREMHLREPRTAAADGGGVHLPWLGAGRSTHLQCAGRHPRRGLQEVRSFEGETLWPFGLFRWRLELTVRASLLSEPVRVRTEDRPPVGSTEQRERRTTPDGDADEFHSLREYRDGEDARRVHGRRSAALGSLVLALWRGREAAERTLVVDLRRMAGLLDLNLQRRLDHHLGCAAWLIDRWTGEGVAFHVLVIDRSIRHWHVQGAGQARKVLGWLTVASAVPYRGLGDEERRQLAAYSDARWIAAGGHRERGTDRERIGQRGEEVG